MKRGTMIGGTYQVLEPLGKGGLTQERQKKAKIYRELGSYCGKKTRQEPSEDLRCL